MLRRNTGSINDDLIFLTFKFSDFADSSFVVVRLNSTWFYNVSLSTSLVQVYNLTVNQINDVTMASFIDLTSDAEGFQLINVTVQGIKCFDYDNFALKNEIHSNCINGWCHVNPFFL